MPFLRFDLDAKHLVPKVARAAGVNESVIGWGLLELWEWCWRTEVDKVDRYALAGFFGGSESIPMALAAFGFLEKLDGLWRVCGAEKYLRVSDARRAAGAARAASAERDSAGRLTSKSPANAGDAPTKLPALTPSTQHPDPIHPSPEEEAPSSSRPPVAWVPEPPTTPPEGWSGEDFWRWAQAKRHKAGFIPEKPPHHRELSAWWARARGLAGSTRRLQEAWYAYGESEHWKAKSFPWAGFVKCFENFTPRSEGHG